MSYRVAGATSYLRETFRLTEDLQDEPHLCRTWSAALAAYPRSNALWALRDAPDLITMLFVDGAWDAMTLEDRRTVLYRASARTWTRPTRRASPVYVAPRMARAVWEHCVFTVVKETIRRQLVDPLPSRETSPLTLAYAVMRRYASPTLTMAIDMMCSADVYATHRGIGQLLIGPSTAVDGSWGAIAVGDSAPIDVPLEGRPLRPGTWQAFRSPAVTNVDGLVWDCSVVMSIPAVVVSSELAQREPNVRMYREAGRIWVGCEKNLRSEELFMWYPRGAVVPAPAVL